MVPATLKIAERTPPSKFSLRPGASLFCGHRVPLAEASQRCGVGSGAGRGFCFNGGLFRLLLADGPAFTSCFRLFVPTLPFLKVLCGSLLGECEVRYFAPSACKQPLQRQAPWTFTALDVRILCRNVWPVRVPKKRASGLWHVPRLHSRV